MERKRKLDWADAPASSSASSLGGAAQGAVAAPTVNPLNGRPYSDRYHKLRAQRMKLPVFQFLEQLETFVRSNQVVIVEGETGSGKTTQVRADSHSCLDTRIRWTQPILVFC